MCSSDTNRKLHEPTRDTRRGGASLPTVPAFPNGSWKAFILNRFPGPGVHAVRPDTSISQRLEVSVALPGRRQLIPMMAIGSTEPWPLFSTLLFVSHPLSTDHGDEEYPSLSAVSLSAPSRWALVTSPSIVLRFYTVPGCVLMNTRVSRYNLYGGINGSGICSFGKARESILAGG